MTLADSARARTIMLVAGEPSGDALGGELMRALRTLGGPHLRLVGVGGERMREAGLQSLYGLSDTAVMGLREVVPRIPAILRRVRQARDFAVRIKPDVLVLIDSPDFTHRIAAAVRRADPAIPLVDYVAPQVWASRPYRAKKMAAIFDHLLALLPFEPPFFEAAGLPATFVGHPVIERAAKMTGGAAFRARHGIAADAPLLLVLPGSRMSEIRFIEPVFAQTLKRLAAGRPALRVVTATVPNVAARVREAARAWPGEAVVVTGEAEKFAAFDAADVALAASGTVTTELALARTPMVVGYRVGALTAALVRRFITAKYVTLVNLILDRPAVPELVQENLTPARAADELARLLDDPAHRSSQIAALEAAAARLGAGGAPPSIRAARVVLDIAERGAKAVAQRSESAT